MPLPPDPSPYPRARATDAVRWRTWGADAHADAASLDRPILLLIGRPDGHDPAAALFGDPRFAVWLADHVVPVVVDADTRPDLESVYLHAAVAGLTGAAGGPLTLLLTPEGRPFSAALALPAEPTETLPSLRQWIARGVDLWTHERAAALSLATRLTAGLHRAESLADAPGADADTDWVEVVARVAARRVDPTNGALQVSSGVLAALLTHHRRTGRSLDLVRAALDAPTGPEAAPHRLPVLLDAWRLTGDPRDEATARATAAALIDTTDAAAPTVLAALRARALLHAGSALSEPTWTAAGHVGLAALADRRTPDGRVERTPGVAGFLDDHAAVALAHLDAWLLDGDDAHLDRGRALVETTLTHFRDPDGSFRYTAVDAEPLVVTPRRLVSGTHPSGHVLLARAALTLHDATADPRWIELIDALLRPFVVLVRHAPDALGEEAVVWALRHPVVPSTPEVEAPRSDGPTGLCVVGDQLWVVHPGRHQLAVHTLAHDEAGWPRLGPARWLGDGTPGQQDGASPRFHTPCGVDVGGGAVWVADAGSHRLRRVDLATGDVSTAVHLSDPPTAVLATDDAVLIAAGNQVWLYAPGDPPRWQPWIGAGPAGVDDGPAQTATLTGPSALSMMAPWLLWTESGSSRLRAIDLRDRRVRTLLDDGLRAPAGLVAADGVGWLADTGHDRLVAIDLSDGALTVVLGPDVLRRPTAVCRWRGFVLVADSGHDRLVALRVDDGAHRALQ